MKIMNKNIKFPKNTRRNFLKSCALGSAGMCLLSAKQKDNRPNFILIMSDDMGYSDIGCYGGEIKTPNLDKLAYKGIRFTQFYNNAKCGPTRASLLTGQYSHAVGTSNMENGATIGEVLRATGYRTLISGKWHQSPLPTERGFDRYYGLADGCCNFWNPGTKARPGEGPPGRKKSSPRRWAIEDKVIMGYTNPDKNFYTTDAFTDYAIERLEEYKNDDKPFLLYLPYTAPHYPLHAWPEDIAKYRGKYKIGWDKLREERYDRMVKMGIFNSKYKNTLRDEEIPAWNSLEEKVKDEEDLTMAVYAAMIDRMDQNIGRVMKKVKDLGKEKNTLVLFLSDNGACAENPNKTPDIPPGPVESYRPLGKAWANATNTPFKKYKRYDYEGGTCTPFIAYWPDVIKPGGITNQVGHIIDILPTFMDIAEAKYPEKQDEKKLRAPDGKTLLPVFQGKKRTPHDVIFWQFSKAKAVRMGKWKMVADGDSGWELYDLDADRTELNNLAKKFPEKAEKMAVLWDEWWNEYGNKKKSKSSKKGKSGSKKRSKRK